REKLLADSRQELDRLMREQRAMNSRAQLLESNKNDLVEQVERLQRQLQLKSELEEENLHKRVNEGLSSLKSQVDELRRRTQEATTQLEEARAESVRLRRESEESKARAESLKGTHEAALAEVESLQKDNTRLEEDRDRVEKEGEATLEKVAQLEKALADQQSKARGLP